MFVAGSAAVVAFITLLTTLKKKPIDDNIQGMFSYLNTVVIVTTGKSVNTLLSIRVGKGTKPFV